MLNHILFKNNVITEELEDIEELVKKINYLDTKRSGLNETIKKKYIGNDENDKFKENILKVYTCDVHYGRERAQQLTKRSSLYSYETSGLMSTSPLVIVRDLMLHVVDHNLVSDSDVDTVVRIVSNIRGENYIGRSEDKHVTLASFGDTENTIYHEFEKASSDLVLQELYTKLKNLIGNNYKGYHTIDEVFANIYLLNITPFKNSYTLRESLEMQYEIKSIMYDIVIRILATH